LVAYYLAKDVLFMNTKTILRKLFPYIERVFEKPLLFAGKFLGLPFIPFFRSHLFFFFPFYHIGGAEKVHARITCCFKKYNPVVFFSNKSKNSALKKQFMQSARIFDLGHLNNPILVYFWAGFLSTVVNSNKNSIVFGCNNVLYYKLLPHLKFNISCIDLIHAFGGGIENVSIRYISRLDKRVVINTRTLKDLKDQYRLNNIAEKMNDRIFLIENCVQIPERIRKKNDGAVFRILYVGRGSEEKRVHLIGEISYLCHQKDMPVEFVLVGDIRNSMPKQYIEYCNFLGEIVNEKKLSEIYNNSDILLLVSSYEGFPLVIMEAMAHGLVTISTDVGGISGHIRNGYNGFLIKNENEDIIIKNICEVISELTSNEFLMNKISIEAYEYAKANFNCEKFCLKYKNLVLDN
jgi:glycosyltransferase involved in cell wall biosynthesis